MQIKILRRNYRVPELRIFAKSFLRLILSPKKIVNFLLVELSLFFKLKNCLGLPFNINIEPAADCNYRCLKCERFSEDYKDDGAAFDGKLMPFEYFCRIIDDIGDILLSVRLWHFGEPLLNKNIIRMIQYAKKKDIIVALSSNLSVLTAVSAKELVCSGLDYLVVSFDSSSAKTYSLLHGADCFEVTINNIKSLVSAKKILKSPTPFIEMQFIVMKENEPQISRFRELSEEWGVNKVTFLRLDKDKINFRRLGLLKPDGLLPKNKDYVLDKEAIKAINHCGNPWEGALIRYSGLVLPCVEDIGQTYVMGRVFQDGRYISFKQIWNGSNYLNFRKAVQEGINDVEICGNCAQRDNNNEDQISTC